MRFVILIALAAFVIIAVFYLIGCAIANHNTRKAIIKALKKGKTASEETEQIADLIALYMTMVTKYGPNSDEAHAFRFGLDSPLVKKLHNDDEGRKIFQQQADIIDETYRLIHNPHDPHLDDPYLS